MDLFSTLREYGECFTSASESQGAVQEFNDLIDALEEAFRFKGDAVREAQDAVGRLRAEAEEPKYLLARFFGTSDLTGRRCMFDAHVVPVEGGAFFEIPDGYRDIEVDTRTLGR
jgi:hypothetical protein